ncbi:HSP18 transcriptional regulator [Streptomyces sp. NPDC003042]
MPSDHPRSSPEPGPTSFLAAATALGSIERALDTARSADTGTPGPGKPGPGTADPVEAMAALLLLRQVREQLAGWESGLIETARDAGASWADLAGPLGVASRQAAERRYLRLRPGTAGSTGDERVQATRDLRAAERSVTAWARAHAADLRRLAAAVTALPGLPATARTPIGVLDQALAGDDAAALVAPLIAARSHLQAGHPDLTARIDALVQQTDRLRRDTRDQRRGG